MSKFSTWIIFSIIFAFGENTPATTPAPPHKYDITKNMKSVVALVFESFNWTMVYAQLRNNTNNPYTTTIESYRQKLPTELNSYNITMKFELSEFFRARILFPDNTTIRCELATVSLKAYPLDFDHYIATGDIPLNLTLTVPTAQSGDYTSIAVDYHDLDKYNFQFDIHSNYSHYKLNKRNEIRQEFKSQIKKALNEKINGDWKVNMFIFSYMFYRGLGGKSIISENHSDFIKNEEKYYYFIKTIPSTDFILQNVTIRGLWNFRSCSIDFANQAVFLELVSSDVHGTVMQSFASGVEKIIPLRFKANNIYVSRDRQPGKIHVRAEEYSVFNIKSKTPLSTEKSKLIMEKIESAIAENLN